MCFAPQWRALFWYLNVKKWSEPLRFLHFWLGSVLRAKGRALFRHLNFQKCSGADVLNTCSSGNVLRTTTACTFSTSQLPKVVRKWCALYILTWKSALRHNRVHFFDMSISKSGLRMVCFVHFDLETRFALQFIFTISMWNRALAAVSCTFCRPHLEKVVRTHHLFNDFYVKPSSRYSRVHILSTSSWKSGPNPSNTSQLLDDDVIDIMMWLPSGWDS